MELNVGSNVFRNTNGVLKVEGKEQIVLQIQDDHRLFLTMDLYDAGSNHLAHLRRNSWGFNLKNRFEIEVSPAPMSLFTFPACLKVTDREAGGIVIEINLVEKDTVHILNGKFFSHKGQLVEITPHRWRLTGKPGMFGSVLDVRGGVALIG